MSDNFPEGPVTAEAIPAHMNTPEHARAFVAAAARAAEVPAGPTLIDKLSRDEFLDEDDSAPITVGKLKKPDHG